MKNLSKYFHNGRFWPSASQENPVLSFLGALLVLVGAYFFLIDLYLLQ